MKHCSVYVRYIIDGETPLSPKADGVGSENVEV